MFADAFLLTRPWGLLGSTDEGFRFELRSSESPQCVPVGCGTFVVAPARLKITFSGRKTLAAQPEGGTFSWAGGTRQFWTLPLGSAAEESKFKLIFEAEDHTTGVAEIEQTGRPIRPDRPGTASHSERLLALLLAIAERTRSLVDQETGEVDYETIGRKLIAASVPWSLVTEKWCQAYDTDHPPPLDVIVRHAETLFRTVETLAAKPRRVLMRERERLPISRVQELDPACLEWYVRQPGHTTAEKAGSRQTILAVSRHENFDTLENRVLRAYLELAAGAAQGYVQLHDALRGSERLQLVGRFGRMGRSLARDLSEIGVRRAEGVMAPNYVLTHDNRYRQIWEGYQELLRRKEEEDDVWRWQVRLWAEFVRISVLVALRRLEGASVVAEVPMQIRRDQQRGRWAWMEPHQSVIVVPIGDRHVVVTVIDAQSSAASDFGDKRLWGYIWSVGPSCVLHAQDLASGDVTWVIVWGLHPIDDHSLSLRDEARSANRALANLRKRIRLDGGGRPELRGLVIASTVHPDSVVEEGDDGDTLAYSCPLSADRLTTTVDKLVEMLPVVLGS